MPSRKGEPAAVAASEPVGVIDIGSNSVRLVVFDRLCRTPFRIFDERYTCELARDHKPGQAISETKLETVYKVLTRLSVMADQVGAGLRLAVATASIRDAANGHVFVKKASEILGTKVEIASGEREARLLALGIRLGFGDIDAVAADLGGGSMEVSEICDSQDSKSPLPATFPFGVLRNQEAFEADPVRFIHSVRTALVESNTVKAMQGKPLILVGGAWRALGRILFAREASPFSVLHQFTLAPEKVLKLADEFKNLPLDEIKNIKAANRLRRPYLKLASVLLELLIETGQPSEVIISCTGIREGLLASQLSQAELRLDPLLESARAFAVERARNPDYGEALYHFIKNFMTLIGWKLGPENDRLIHAAALFANCHWRIQPGHRGREALNDLTHAHSYGVNQLDRLFIGLCLLVRHDGLPGASEVEAFQRWVTPETLKQATQIGLMMRLAKWLGANSAEAINNITLRQGREADHVHIIMACKPFALEPPIMPRVLEHLSEATGISIHIGFKGEIPPDSFISAHY